MAGNSFYEAYVEVIPTAKGFERSLNKQLAGPSIASGGAAGGAAGGGFVAGFGKAIPLIGGVLAAAGLGNIIGDAITNASDYQQAQGAVEDVFGKLGADAVKAFAAGGAENVGQSMNDILSASSTFGIFGKAAGLADGDLVDFSGNLITLGADLSAFANTTPEEAVEALSAGLRGESEPLRKYGILLDDATLKAKAMEMGIYDGNGPLTQQQRILAANAVIFEQTAIQQGKFAEESDTLAGRQATLAASIENVSTKLGEAFLPIAEDVVGFLLDEGVPALEDFADWFNEPETQEGIAAVGGMLKEFGGFAKEAGDNFTGTVGLIEIAVGLLNGMSMEEFKEKVLELPGPWGDLYRAIESSMMGAAGQIGVGIFNVRNFAGEVGANIGAAVGFFQSLPGKIGAALGGLGDRLFNAGRSIVGRFAEGIRSMIGDVGRAVGGVMDFVAGFFPNSPAAWGPLSGSGWTKIGTAGTAISNQLASGIESGYSRVRSATAGLASAAIPAMGDTYVQNPFTGDYLLAQAAGVADSRIAVAGATSNRNDNAGRRIR